MIFSTKTCFSTPKPKIAKMDASESQPLDISSYYKLTLLGSDGIAKMNSLIVQLEKYQYVREIVDDCKQITR